MSPSSGADHEAGLKSKLPHGYSPSHEENYSGIDSVLCVGFLRRRERAKREPMTFVLDCAGGDCPLLKGAPQTGGMRGGSVKLKPGESVGWHSIATGEEALVILHGSGVANIRPPRCATCRKNAGLYPTGKAAERREQRNHKPWSMCGLKISARLGWLANKNCKC
jgi:hypothetical protein